MISDNTGMAFLKTALCWLLDQHFTSFLVQHFTGFFFSHLMASCSALYKLHIQYESSFFFCGFFSQHNEQPVNQ